MGKTYIDTVKYLVFADVTVEGLVDKPDIVGAIFGQTEGLLGDELDLRDLQKNGRIGRIEVEKSKSRNGTTSAVIKIPSSLDMVETCIIAAALESVDRVGPCEARINVSRIEDTRNIKRRRVVDKAKGLLKSLLDTEIPESREITESVREEVKKAEITFYGRDKLPAGPNIEKSDQIIIVEGRADVLNLLKNDITNVVAMQGARVLPTILDLIRKKEATLFLDGDRGGDLIIRALTEAGAEVDFVSRAPRGREVEELTRKEIIKSLRNKIPFEQEVPSSGKGENNNFVDRTERKVERPSFQQSTKQIVKKPRVVVEPPKIKSIKKTQEVKKQLRKVGEKDLVNELGELKDSLKARLFNENLEMIEEIRVRDIIKALEERNDITVIVFDGIITQRLVDLASGKGIVTIFGSKVGNVNKIPDGIKIVTLDGEKTGIGERK